MKAFRLHHLIFAISVLFAYVSAEELGIVHAWLGYAIAGLLLMRFVLGLARTRGFEFRRLLPRLSAPPAGLTRIRHPAIAHALSLVLLTCVTGAAVTGIVMDKGGTLAGNSIRADDREEDEEDDQEEEFGLGLVSAARAETGESEEDEALEEGHETFGNLVLPVALAHALYMLLFRFELARFMIFAPRRRVA